jgi:membrane associated rhomboid family serine protease
MVRLPKVVAALLGVLIAVTLLRSFLPFRLDDQLVATLALVLRHDEPLAPARYYTLLTHALVHGGWLHLLFNGFWIAALGTLIHRALGNLGFCLLFTVSVIAGGLASLVAFWGYDVVLIGASGGVFGLIGAFGHIGVAKPWERPLLRLRKLVVFTLLMMIINFAYGYIGGVPGSNGDAIAWEAHAGGFIAGLLLFPLLTRLPGAQRLPYIR